MAGTATEPLVGRTAIELAAAVREGRASPQDVVEAHLEWIESLDRSIHAFQVVRPDGVREEARALASRADLRELPLAGVPVAIKDNLEMAGYATRSGTLASPDEPAASDDELVRRLRRAGAIPLGTTVADVALMLDVLAGTQTYRAVAPPSGSLRIAASSASPAIGVKVHPEVERVFQATAEALRSSGHAVIPADPPYRPTDSLPFLHRAFVGGAEEAESLRFEALERRTQSWVRTGHWLRRNRPPRPSTAEALRSRFQGWFDQGGYDLLLTPTLATPPLRIGAYQGKGLWPTILGLTRFMPYPPLQNLLGFPAISVPAGRSSEGLPIGVQLVAPKGTEALLLSVALQLETARPWPRHASLEGVQRS